MTDANQQIQEGNDRAVGVVPKGSGFSHIAFGEKVGFIATGVIVAFALIVTVPNI
jgi:hypothetical protein